MLTTIVCRLQPNAPTAFKEACERQPIQNYEHHQITFQLPVTQAHKKASIKVFVEKHSSPIKQLSTMGSTKDHSSKKSTGSESTSKVYRKPAPCSPLTCNKSGSGNIRQNLRNLNEEQQRTLSRIKKLEEKIEKKQRAKASSTSKLDSELQQALDGLMKTVGNQNLLD